MDLLAHMWRYPTVSVHGIEGAFSDSGTKTVIPAKVTAKFSIRQVPDMDPAMVKKQVKQDFQAGSQTFFSILVVLFAAQLFWHYWLDVLGDRLPSLCIRQEEESQQAESHNGDWGKAVAGRHSAFSVRGREGGSQERCISLH